MFRRASELTPLTPLTPFDGWDEWFDAHDVLRGSRPKLALAELVMAVTRDDWVGLVHEALMDAGGSAPEYLVAKHIWANHEAGLRAAGEPLFYTWQYDIWWAAQKLRDKGVLATPGATKRGEWVLSGTTGSPNSE